VERRERLRRRAGVSRVQRRQLRRPGRERPQLHPQRAGERVQLYYVSVGGYNGAIGSFVLNVSSGSGTIGLSFTDLGPATIGFSVTGGASYGQYMTIFTLNQGACPNGWFFGLDILPFELQLMLGIGPPFSGQLDVCGSMSFGPVGGAPTGLSVYGIVLGFSPGAAVPTSISNPVSVVIP
jgi:hypothetical protein